MRTELGAGAGGRILSMKDERLLRPHWGVTLTERFVYQNWDRWGGRACVNRRMHVSLC